MNYLYEILAFYDFLQSNRLSTGQIALWHALIYINNKCRWEEWFTAPNLTLELLTGLSRQAITKNRNVLKQFGLIDFKSNGTKATIYKLLSIANSLQDSSQVVYKTVDKEFTKELQDSCTLNKQNKTIKKINNINNTAYVRAYEVYEQNIGTISPIVVDAINGYIADGVEDEMICLAIEEAVNANKRSWNYVNAVLRDKEKRGIKTATAYRLQAAEWSAEKRRNTDSAGKPKKSKFNNYDDDNKVDYAELEEQILDKMLGEE